MAKKYNRGSGLLLLLTSPLSLPRGEAFVGCRWLLPCQQTFSDMPLHRRLLPRAVVVDEVSEEESLSTSYKIVAGLEPEWFDRFVVEPLGNTEIIDGQPLTEILAQGKTYSVQWSEIQKSTKESAEQIVDDPNTDRAADASNTNIAQTDSPDSVEPTTATVDADITSAGKDNIPVVSETCSSDEGTDLEVENPVDAVVDLRSRKSFEPAFVQSAGDQDSPDATNKAARDMNDFKRISEATEGSSQLLNVGSTTTQSSKSDTQPSSSPLKGVDRPSEPSEDTVDRVFVEKKERNTPKPHSETDSAMDEPSTKTDSLPSDDRVVIYKGLFSKPWKQLPLQRLVSLGYSEDDITDLIPDTLELIASEGIKYPSTGIPARWKKKGSTQEVVRVVFSSEAKAFLRPDKETDSPTKLPVPRKQVDTGDGTREVNEGRSDSVNVNPMEGRRKQRQQYSDRQEFARKANRRRERVGTLKDGSPKPVYNGRQSSKAISTRRRGDPPSPNSIFWPDIDTFRKLLRTEAQLRLRILGDGWAETVKEETMWRHDLYSDWLWTLKNGLGNPIVESRSDRHRRLRDQALMEDSKDLRKRRKRSRDKVQ